MRQISENQKLVEKFKKEYWETNRERKSQILGDLQKITGLNRNYLVQLLSDHHDLKNKAQSYHLRNQLPRKSKYGLIRNQLEELWEISNYETGKRLVGSIHILLESLTRHKEIDYTLKEKRLLLQISAATIDRQLKGIKQDAKGRYHNPPGTHRGDLLKNQIPIRTHRDWVEKKPGYLEIDTVHHCGGNLSGQYILSLSTIDVYSGWNECRGMLNRRVDQIDQNISVINGRLPVDIKGVDFDGGSEFVNHRFLNYCHKRHITYTRARADRKNDQCFVEQNNDSVVRRYLGYARYETQEELIIINKIYEKLSDYYNFFQAVMRISSKTYHEQNRTPTRHYDKAQTPYQRLMACPSVSEKTKQQLTERFLILNPKKLRDDIQKLQTLLSHLNRQNRPTDYL